MKKTLLLFFCLCLMGCQSETREAKYTLEKFQPVPAIKQEKSAYTIYDPLLPSFANFEVEPDERLIDWDIYTSLQFDGNHAYHFNFDGPSHIRGIIIESTDIHRVKLELDIETITITAVNGEIIFDETIVADSAKLSTKDQGRLSEIHFIVDREVDLEAYNQHQSTTAYLNQVNMKFRSETDPYLNLQRFEDMKADFDFEQYVVHERIVDFEQLTQNVVGYPMIIKGQVVDIQEKKAYYEIIIKPVLSEKHLKLITEFPVEINKIINITGMYLGEDEHVVFYGINNR